MSDCTGPPTSSAASKTEVLDLIAERFGGIDYLIYSVAAPRRIDPRTGETYQSVIKPIGAAAHDQDPRLRRTAQPALQEIAIEPATDEEVAAHRQGDGRRGLGPLGRRALDERDLLAAGLQHRRAVLHRLRPHRAPIYRQGTIGAAKAHLEADRATLTRRLSRSVAARYLGQRRRRHPGVDRDPRHRACTSASCTTCSATAMQSTDAAVRRAVGPAHRRQPLDLDEEGRIRLDRWELDRRVQAAVARPLGVAPPRTTIAELADPSWFLDEVRRLYGFDVPGVDYESPTEVDTPWP